MQVIDMPPNLDAYPEHDHAESGQEEVFVVMRGGGEIEVDGERVPIDADTVVRVGPGARRKLWPGGDGLRVLALGGTPGKAYEPPDITKLGEPDPMAA
jgi:mannose-6-phosphate isomerase-like protein (cupin superfamily)